MKKIIALTLILLSTVIKAQSTFSCQAEGSEEIQAYKPSISDNALPIDPNKKYVINVYFHIMNNTDGTNNSPNPHQYGIVDVMRAVRMLNVTYNQYNIYFKYVGFEIVNNTEYSNHVWTYPLELNNPEAFNIFFANFGECGSGCAFVGNTRSVLSYSLIEGPDAAFAFVHEIGHNLNLEHTYKDFNVLSLCEHVTRDENNPEYNANTKGDKVADTPAQSPMIPADFTNCTYNYNLSRTDCQGTPYENVDRRNYMGLDHQQSYCEHFTPGQVERMKQYLEAPLYSGYTLAYNDVSSLYEPYSEVLVPGNTIISTEELPDGGGVLVCRDYIFKRSYQAGFTYDFYNTEPVDHLHANIYQLFTYNDRPDHSIKVVINQVDPSVAVSSSTISTLLPYSCAPEPYVSGMIYSMEVLGSMNMTVQELTEIQVKDPEKYEVLMKQYYNILQKMTASGIIKEQVIYKN